jgi:hypothetical protein
MHQIESAASLARHPGASGPILDPAGSREGDGPPPDRRLVPRIAEARERLARAERRVVRMRMSLRGLDRTGPEFQELLCCLHALERSRFIRQLELDMLLRERARSGPDARREARIAEAPAG